MAKRVVKIARDAQAFLVAAALGEQRACGQQLLGVVRVRAQCLASNALAVSATPSRRRTFENHRMNRQSPVRGPDSPSEGRPRPARASERRSMWPRHLATPRRAGRQRRQEWQLERCPGQRWSSPGWQGFAAPTAQACTGGRRHGPGRWRHIAPNAMPKSGNSIAQTITPCRSMSPPMIGSSVGSAETSHVVTPATVSQRSMLICAHCMGRAGTGKVCRKSWSVLMTSGTCAAVTNAPHGTRARRLQPAPAVEEDATS